MKQPLPLRIVRLAPAVGLSTLFRPLPKVAQRPALDVTYRPQHGGLALRFEAPEALGMPEQTLLLTLLELAQERLAESRREQNAFAVQARRGSPRMQEALPQGTSTAAATSLRVDVSWRELGRRLGSDGGGAQRLHQAQLRRLCQVQVSEFVSGSAQSPRQWPLVTATQDGRGRLHITLGDRLAAAVMGAQYAKVSLTERASLTTDTARAIHTFVSTVLRAGASLPVRTETLMERLWGEDCTLSPTGTVQARRKRVHDSLQALDALPLWRVSWPRPGLAKILRLQSPTRQSEPHKRRLVPTGRQECSAQQTLTAMTQGIDVSGLLFGTGARTEPGSFDNGGAHYRCAVHAEIPFVESKT